MIMTLFAALTLAVAAGPIIWLARAPLVGLHQWLVASAVAMSMSGAAVVVGPWVLLSLHLRPVVLAALIAASAAAAYRAVRTPSAASPAPVARRRFMRQSSTACVFGLLLIDGYAGRVVPSQPTDLDFPLRAGVYAVLQGGNSVVTNSAHHWFPSDRYAVDLVKVSRLGNRARGIAPARLDDYSSYDVAVYSPCAGIAEEAVNDVPDQPPGAADPKHRSRNHVELRCGAVRVLLAHLRRGSVLVTVGTPVRRGQIVGRIGNSGYSREPHLHVSAVAPDSQEPWPHTPGVPITFGGWLLFVNEVVR